MSIDWLSCYSVVAADTSSFKIILFLSKINSCSRMVIDNVAIVMTFQYYTDITSIKLTTLRSES